MSHPDSTKEYHEHNQQSKRKTNAAQRAIKKMIGKTDTSVMRKKGETGYGHIKRLTDK